MSPRADLAERIAARLREWDLCSPYGGDVALSEDHRCRVVAFSRPATLDGTVSVYSEKFVLVEARGRLAASLVGSDFQAVYTSEADALSFLELAFVRHDAPAARAVPTRAPRSVRVPAALRPPAAVAVDALLDGLIKSTDLQR